MDKKKSSGREASVRLTRTVNKKNQHYTVNSPINDPSPNHTTPTSKPKCLADIIKRPEPIQVSLEQRFDNLLAFFERIEPFIPEEDPNLKASCAYQAAGTGLPLLASPSKRNTLYLLKPIVIKIMRSGIFYRGGLKGWHLHEDIYESYPIEDLDQFIFDLSVPLWTLENKKSGYDLEMHEYFLSEGMKSFLSFIGEVEIFKGLRPARRLKTKLTALENLANEVLAKPDLSKPSVSKPQVKQKVFDIFRKHIKAPDSKIAEGVAELLSIFGIQRTPEAIRRKSSRKKKTK
jgi:hypothetical protein